MLSICRRATQTLSLLLCYLLVILLCSPFAVSARSTLPKNVSGPTQDLAPARYRDGELLDREFTCDDGSGLFCVRSSWQGASDGYSSSTSGEEKLATGVVPRADSREVHAKTNA